MLDAAHGKTVGSATGVQWLHVFCVTPKVACAYVLRRFGRRRPGCADRAGIRQGSRLTEAVARSRRCVAIAQRNAAEGAEQWFLLQLPVHRAARLSRAGRSLGRRRPASVPRRLRPNPSLCHSERSGSTNAASAETACGLCRARRRKTNAVQSRICLRILLYRFFVDLPIFSE